MAYTIKAPKITSKANTNWYQDASKVKASKMFFADKDIKASKIFVVDKKEI